MSKTIPATVAIGALLAAASGSMAADDWPSQPIRIIVPLGAGGGSDVQQRYFAEQLSEALGQTVTVENMGGAGGAVGGGYVARAEPDGYTILGTHIGTVAGLANVQTDLPYDPMEDLVPVVRFSDNFTLIGINASSGFETFEEMAEYAREHPGELMYATGGVGAVAHFWFQGLADAADIELQHIPYSGGASWLSDLIAGRVNMAADGVIVSAQVPAGTMNALVVLGDRRFPAMPDVPTTAEILPSYQKAESYQMYLVPKGTPEPIIERLATEMRRIAALPETEERLAELTAFPIVDDDDFDIRAQVRESYDTFGYFVEATGVRAD